MMDLSQASVLSHEEVARILQTNLSDGLTAFEARERLKKFGANELEGGGPRKGGVNRSTGGFVRSAYERLIGFLKQFTNPLIQLLLLCVVISISIGEYESAISVVISILIVSIISSVQEIRTDKSLEKLNKNLPNISKVVREGKTHEVESFDLVPGDIVILTEGQRIPADIRLFEVHSFTLNESNLTGETRSQIKSDNSLAQAVTDSLNQLGEGKIIRVSNFNNQLLNKIKHESGGSNNNNVIAINMALMGTMVEAGHAKGIVVATGKATRYGQVFNVVKNTSHPKSPLQINIDVLSMHLVILASAIIALLSIVGVVQKRPVLEVMYYAISLAVTAIPEGLPVVVAVIMAFGMIRLSKQQSIVKSLNSMETLGCFQVLCADKTGTFTRTDMTLTDIVTSELHSLSSGELEELNRDECRKQMTFNKFGSKMYSIGRLMEAGTLCNNASYDPNHNETTYSSSSRYIGQATECALLDAALRLGFGDSRTKFDRLNEQPFNSTSRRMAVQCQRTDLPGNSPMWYVKGAWEEILEDCTHYYEHGLVKPRTNEMWLEYARICSTLGSQGLRVLALATGQTLEQLTYVGVVGITNAPREGIANTVSRLKNEFHVDVKMITGDSKMTAVAVGRSLGLIEAEDSSDCMPEDVAERRIMSGDQLHLILRSPELTEAQKAREIFSKSVFYRVDPIQKADIVSKIQEMDKIVAMTGDGVNDIVSLKRANLSLAMGSGADVCKEVADIIVVDNDLQTLVAAVIEGKGIYVKIRSFMTYQISLNISLILLIAVAYATKNECPFTVIQLLFINLLADGPPAQSLGMEKILTADLDLRPRNVHEPIINCAFILALIPLTSALAALNGLLYYSVVDDGELDGREKSMMFTCFVFCSIFAALSLRSRVKTTLEVSLGGNKELLFCCSAVVAIQVMLIQIDPINDLFDTDPLDSLEFIYLFLYSSLVLIFMDTIKLVSRVCRLACIKRCVDYFRTRKLRLAGAAPPSSSTTELGALDQP